MIASGCDDGTFCIWDLRSFQVCLLLKHLFSFGIDQLVNLCAPLRQCCKEWCKCFFGHPKKWKICSCVKNRTCKKLMDSAHKAYAVPSMCLPMVWLFVFVVLIGT